MDRKRRLIILFVAWAIALGCTNDSDIDNSLEETTTQDDDQSVHDFLSYKITVWDATRDENLIVGINALRIDSLSEVTKVDVSADGSLRLFPNGFQTGQYDDSTYSIDHYHTSNLIYLNEGKLFRLPVYQVSTPEPISLSTETGGYFICDQDYRRANDYANQNNSRLVYKKIDTHELSDCPVRDGEWYMVRFDDTALDSPRRLPTSLNYVVEAVHAAQDGSSVAWITVDDGILKQYDTEFSASTSISVNGTPVKVEQYAQLVTRTAQKRFVIEIDNQLLIYDPNTLQVLNNQFLFTADEGNRVGRHKSSDGTSAYFIEEPKSSDVSQVAHLYALSLHSGDVRKLATETEGIGLITLTNDYVVYTVEPTASWSNGRGVKTLLKTDGATTDIALPLGANGVANVYAAGNYFYVVTVDSEKYTTSLFPQHQATGIHHGYHQIVGIAYGAHLNPAKNYLDIEYFVVLQNDLSTQTKSLHAIETATGEMFTLGSFEPDAYLGGDFEFIEALGHRHALVGVYFNGIRDLYYIDIATAQSLKRLSNYTIDNENGIYYKQATR